MRVSQEEILDIVQKHAPDAAATITRDMKIEDAGIDSYSLIEVIFELEDQLEIDIPYNANDGTFNEAETVGDLLDEVIALVDKA